MPLATHLVIFKDLIALEVWGGFLPRLGITTTSDHIKRQWAGKQNIFVLCQYTTRQVEQEKEVRGQHRHWTEEIEDIYLSILLHKTIFIQQVGL